MADLPILDELRRDLRVAALRDERPARRRVGLLRPALALGAAAAAAAFVVAVGPESSGPAADEASPAPEMLHLVLDESTVRGGRAKVDRRVETWMTTDRCRGRTIFERPPGRTFGELTETPAMKRTFLAGQPTVRTWRRSPADAYEIDDPVAAARRAVESGRAVPRGGATVDGRTLEQYVLREGPMTRTYLVDAATRQPVEMALERRGTGWFYRWRVVTYERVPLDPARLRMTPRPGKRVVREHIVRDEGRAPVASRDARRPWCHPGGR